MPTIQKTSSQTKQPTHWGERYWVARNNRTFHYERYCWLEGRKIRRCHIRGSATVSRLAEIEEAIAAGMSPAEIVHKLKN